jgi:hypothetical protein
MFSRAWLFHRRGANRRTMRRLPLLCVLVASVALPWCTCQRAENIEAKEKLSRPAPPDRAVKAAEEKIDPAAADDPAVMRRVSRMQGAEIWARLKSFSFDATADLHFGRGEGGLKAGEKTRLVQAEGGEFAIETITGDNSELRVAYVNEVFYLKNNNGQWRMSRDPDGERNAYRHDALGVWRSFYDLYEHALKIEKAGVGTHAGRGVVKYKISVPDQAAVAAEEGKAIPQPPEWVMNDAGILEDPEPPAERRKRIHDRVSNWRKRAKPAGGRGEVWIDEETAVPLVVKFDGALVVADGPSPSRLTVKIDQKISEVGKPLKVSVPKGAIEEIARTKMPVRPRELLEDEGIVAQLPRDGGPAGAPASAGGGKKQPAPSGDIPDDE